ncbi:saccharolysin [[Candida] railenensis]|uniref:Saccharolysin n=1 Tax=[Candida] railenensis TaxID=45579 RepID=A0A9P0QTI8_9ASCO|nr:saccharolysin [[Candida] railenensis]
MSSTETTSSIPQPAEWNHTPEEITSLTKKHIELYTRFLDEIAAIENPTVENVLIPFGNFENENYYFQNQIPFYQYVSDSKEHREASQEASKLLNEAYVDLAMRVDLYNVFKKLEASARPEDFPDAESKRLLEKVILDYERNGLHLSEEKRNELKKIQNKLNDLSLEFSKNNNEEEGFLLLTKEQLKGVPEATVKQFEEEKGDDGETLYKVTFKYPDILPVLKYAQNQQTRKEAFIADANKVKQNDPLLLDLIKYRFELAQVLGYDNISKYILEDRLAKTETRVLDFLTDLKTKLSPLAKVELEKLKNLKDEHFQEQGLDKQDKFYIWDNRFYDNLMLEKDYQVDNTKIAEYFPLQSTIEKMLSFYENLFDVKFVETTEGKHVWHEEVKQFAVYQNIKAGSPKNLFLGWIYFDLHPRKGKYGHAANFSLFPGYVTKSGEVIRPVTALVCNFTKPTKDTPSLLKHDEVVTFFHELGHGMHDILGFTKFARFHGTNVPRDFVEAPSQSFEYWTWSKNEVKSLSSHYETGEPIPDALIDQLIKSKNVNGALFNLRQLHFAFFDMKVHVLSKKEDIESLDLLKLWNDAREELTGISNGGINTYGYGSFGHIAGGYESGYYGYLFSKVYADDIYYSIFKNDPLNQENGIKYRDYILSKGGSREVMEGVVELLGREPTLDAFLEELGL